MPIDLPQLWLEYCVASTPRYNTLLLIPYRQLKLSEMGNRAYIILFIRTSTG